MNARLARLGLSIALVAAPGCRGCNDEPARGADPAATAREIPSELPAAPRLDAPEWAPVHEGHGIGLPSGCVLEPPVKVAKLPEATRFVGGRDVLDALALATASGARSLVELDSKRVRDVPWTRFDEPPLLERAGSLWVAARAVNGHARLFRDGLPELELARGDRLQVADLACAGERCAILTTLAKTPIAPGASLAIGPARDVKAWTTLDLEPSPDAAWYPLAIVRMTEREVVAALASEKRVSFWRVADGKRETLGEVTTEFGAWDVTSTPAPLVIAPGRASDGGCSSDDLPIRLHPLSGEAHTARADVAPPGVIARSLDKGALVAWVAPVSCLIPSRNVVRLLHLDERGAPRSAPMSVADASGFALAASGQRMSLWLRTPIGVTWVRARCQ